MEVKEHYKMYKDGKRWVFAAITVATIGLGTAVSQDVVGHADTTSGTATAQSSGNSAEPSATATLTSSTGSQTTGATITGTEGTGNENTGTGASSTETQGDTTTETTADGNQGTPSNGTDNGTTGAADADSTTGAVAGATGDSDNNATGDTADTDTSIETSSDGTQTAGNGSGAISGTADSETTGNTGSETANNVNGTTSGDESEGPDESADVDNDMNVVSTPDISADTAGVMSAKMLTTAAPVNDSNILTYDLNADGSATITGATQDVGDTLVIPSTITDSAGNVLNVTAIGQGFSSNYPNTQNLKTLIIENGITSIADNAFSYLKNLSTIDLSQNRTLTTIGNQAFVDDGLTTLVLPDSVTTIGSQAFASNPLTNVTFSQNLQTIGDMAFEYDPLTSIDLGNSTNLTAIGDLAFFGSQASSLTLPTGLVTIGNQAFASSGKLTSVTIPATVTTIGNEAFLQDSQLANLTFAAGSQLQTIGDSAFTYTGLTSVTLPASLVSIGDSAFAANSALTTLTFAADGNLTTIGAHAFENDNGITTLVLPASLTTLGDFAFSTIHGLTSVTFADGTQPLTIGNSAFIYDTALTSITLPANLTSIGDQAFLSATSLPTITFPANLVSIGANAFTYDQALKSVDLTGATSLTTIDKGAFEYSGLTGTLVLPTNLITVGDLAFAGDDLTGVTLNEQLQSIGDSAFIYNQLTGSVILPATLTSLGDMAFYGNQLTTVNVPANVTQIGDNVFSYNRINQLTTDTGTTNLALNQNAYYAATQSTLTLADLFNVDLGGVTLSPENISGLTGGVTLASDGTFNIPAGLGQFTFNWSVPTDATTYTGQYQVVLNNPDIKVFNSTIFYGDQWTPASNFVSAVNSDGSNLALSDITVTAVDSQGNSVSLDALTSKAGIYQVTYKSGNNSAVAQVTVAKRTANYTITGNQTVTYNGQTPTLDVGQFSVSLTNDLPYTLKDGDLILAYTDANGNQVLLSADNAADFVNAGTYNVVVNPAALERLAQETPALANYDWSGSKSLATLTIAPAVLNVTVPDQTMVYGGQEPTPTLTVTDANGNVVTDSGLTVTRVAGDNVGVYDYQVSGLNDNYTLGNESIGTLTITPATLNVNVPDQTMVYGGQEPTPTLTVTDANGNIVTDSGLTVTRVAGDNVGEYAYQISGLSDNYTLGNESIGTLTIAPATLNVTVANQTMVYGGQEPTPTLTVTDANGNIVTDSGLTVTRVAGDNVGEYAYQISGLSDNYTLGNESIGTLTITPATLNVNVPDQTMVYGGQEPTPTLTVTDANGNIVTDSGLTVTRDSGDNVGTYAYHVSGLNSNYTLGNESIGSLTITPAALNVTVANQTMVYGGQEPTPTLTVTDANGNIVTDSGLTVTREPGNTADTYHYLLNTDQLNANYKVDDPDLGILTIAKADLNVTVANQTMVYGGQEPTPTLTVTDANGNIITDSGLTVTRKPGNTVGTYQYVLNTNQLNSNYTLGNASIGTLTITPAALNVTVANQTMVYGSQEPTPTLTVTDANGNVITDSGLTVTRDPGDNVGEYAYHVSGLNGNYTSGNASIGTLTITPAALNVTVANQTMVYGGQEPTPILTVTDANGNVVTDSGLTVTRDPGDNAGEYAYHVSGLSSNYTLGNESIGSLTIAKAVLNVSVPDQAMIYGGQEPTPTLTVTDANGNVVTDSGLTVTRDPGDNVGEYAYHVSGLNDNYTLGNASIGTLTITPAALNVTVANQTMIYGGQEPTPTLTVTDADGNVVTDSGLTVTRDPGDNAGTYAYHVSGLNGNYTLGNASIGALTITQLPLTVTVGSQTMVAGTKEPAAGLTVVDSNGNPITDSGLTVTREPGNGVGNYLYILNVDQLNANYKVGASELGSLSITAAADTLTGSDYTMTVGDAAPTAADFKAAATDGNAQPVASDQITLDLGNADLTQPGQYQVTLSYGNAQPVTVTLTVVAKTTGGGNGDGGNSGGTDPVGPTDPTDPTDPTAPTKPTDPSTPKDPDDIDHEVISDGGVGAQVRPGIDVTITTATRVPQRLVTSGAGAHIQTGNSGTPQTATPSGAVAQHSGRDVQVDTSSKTAPVAHKAAQQATTLPQTNEAHTSGWSILGLILGGLGLLGFRKRRQD